MAKRASRMVKPAVKTRPLELSVLRREQLSPGFSRVTVGGPELAEFVPMGFDQWFRLFLPVHESSLGRLPKRMNLFSYAFFLAIPEAVRPILRNYTVREFRPAGVSGPELDIDFVLHGEATEVPDAAAGADEGRRPIHRAVAAAAAAAGRAEAGDASHAPSGPAATWASLCEPGDTVSLLDEGIGFSPAENTTRYLLVGDETALPAVAGVLRDLPADAEGTAIIEVPHEADRQEVTGPDGVEVVWLARDVLGSREPGAHALERATAVAGSDPIDGLHAYVSGESQLATGLRRHLVADLGVSPAAVNFCGYWRAPRAAARTRRG